MKWKQKDGKEIEVSEMSDAHLNNAYLLILSKQNLFKIMEKELLAEMCRRSDGENLDDCAVGGIDRYGSI